MRLFSRVILFTLLLGVPRAQGEYPLDGLSPPIGRFDLLVDGQVEDPPVYNGGAVLPRPASGGTVQFQIFVPSAARKQAFGYILEFDDTNRVFSDHFEIRSVTTWMPVYDISRRVVEYLWGAKEVQAPLGSGGPGRSILFVDPPTMSSTGLVATVSLAAKQNIGYGLPLTVRVSVAVFSVTPPTRLWHIKGERAIHWM